MASAIPGAGHADGLDAITYPILNFCFPNLIIAGITSCPDLIGDFSGAMSCALVALLSTLAPSSITSLLAFGIAVFTPCIDAIPTSNASWSSIFLDYIPIRSLEVSAIVG
jgi:hypothetical protein